MKLAMSQPAFLPWQGFFELIWRSELFILLDDFQFSNHSYHQRNRLFVGPGKSDWATVPVLKANAFQSPLNAVRIDEAAPWRKKMLRRLQHSYARAPYFDAIMPPVAAWLDTRAGSLAEQNIAFITLVLELLGWQRQLVRSSAYPGPGARSQRVLELLRAHGASSYLSARGSFGYMHEDGVFPVPDIELRFQQFVPQPYRQVGADGQFVPSLSVLDALFNVGPQETARLISSGTTHWLDWQGMIDTLAPGACISGEMHGI